MKTIETHITESINNKIRNLNDRLLIKILEEIESLQMEDFILQKFDREIWSNITIHNLIREYYNFYPPFKIIHILYTCIQKEIIIRFKFNLNIIT